MHYTVYKTTAL